MRVRLPIAVCAAALTLALAAAPASAYRTSSPWPPAGGAGLFAHYGEEHWNDDDGLTLLPKVVEETIRYRPRLVTMSGDKDNNGTTAELERWRRIMEPYDRARIPYFAGVGNHDREAPPGVIPGTAGILAPPVASLEPYKRVFASRPYPFGDATPYQVPGLSPTERPPTDPRGASSHYYVDFRNVRFVFLDNSCWTLTACDGLQNPPLTDQGEGRTQLTFLERTARAANREGKLVFVVMHMPTRDPRDQEIADSVSRRHVMAKGLTADNAKFEDVAARSGVDAVLLGHIKGQFLYRGSTGIPYYIDGGAGGELYTSGPVGADHGYWHGFRLLRVAHGRIAHTDAVPIFVPNGITLRGPDRLAPGSSARFSATGMQPVFNDPAKVPALELRDPDPVPKQESAAMLKAGFVLLPVALLALGGLLLPAANRRPLALPMVAVVVLGGAGAVAIAQQSAPDSTPKASLPSPARIWTSANPAVLAPVASPTDDPRRDRRSQTQDGLFRARCPGVTRIVIASGFEASSRQVRVPSRRGRIVRSARALGGAIRAGQRRTVAAARLAQPAQAQLRIRSGRRVLRTVRDGCFPAGRELRFAWDGRLRSRGRLRAARPGRYRVELKLRSDRRPVVRSALVRVR
jgi:hypothetical protein